MGSAIDHNDVAWDIRTSDLRQFKSRVSHCLKPFRFVSTASGGYDAAVFRRRLLSLDLVIVRYGNEVTIDAGRLSRLPLLQIPLRGSYCVHLNGRSTEIPTRTAHLLPADYPLVMEWSPDCLLLVVRLGNGTAAADDAFGSMRAAAHTAFGSFASLDARNAASLGHLLDFMTSEAISDGVLTASPDLAASSEELLFRLLPRAFAGEREGLPIPTSPRLVSAERHIEQRLFDEDLTIEDVAAASGMGQRTLYRLFRQVHGKGPMAWARDRRLDLARQCLLEPSAPVRGVTDIALDHGFDHFGRFAAFYRMRFGELPSDTLRRGRLM